MPNGNAVSISHAEPAATRLARMAHRAGRTVGRLDLLTARVKPWMVLGPLVVLGWAVMVYVAHTAVHDGPLYYDGGDGTWYYTTAWELGHGTIPVSNIGYGYPMLLAPVARLAGPNLLAGLPYVTILDALVLSPLALLCLYGLAKVIGGQRFAYLVSGIWVVAPLLAIPYFLSDYYHRYVGQTLPAVLGLTALGDFPSMVALLAAGYFAFRALSTGRDLDALASGLAIGLALAVKPANATFLPAPLLAFAVARRPRALLVLAAGVVPAVICLTVWKYRGIGEIPLFTPHPEALAAGAGSVPVGFAVHLGRYLPFNWNRFAHNIDGFREYTWSRRLIEWTVIGGLIGLARRSLAGATLIGVWLASYLILKGGSIADFYGGGFFRYLAPAFPAAFLLAMSLPFLVPIAGRRFAAHGDLSGWPQSQRARRGVVAAGLALGVLPLIPLLAFGRETAPTAAALPQASLFVPANRFSLSAERHGGKVTLSWPRESSGGAHVKYAIYRSPTDELTCSTPPGGATLCSFPLSDTTEVSTNHWTDTPGSGPWVYRVAVLAAAIRPIVTGDDILLSRPLTVDVPAG